MDRSNARSLIYNKLSLGYLYPDKKVYASIADGEWIRELREALDLLDEENFDDYLKAVEQAISGAKEGEQLAMAREYTRLFISTSPHIIAPLYGSIYMKKDGSVYWEATSELLHLYQEIGFKLKKDIKNLPDHIANELEFMSFLAGEESQSSVNKKIKLEEIQMDFLSRFILPWVPAFCEKVTQHSRSPFYYHLVNLTKEFINFEKNYLGVTEEPNSWKENEYATIGS